MFEQKQRRYALLGAILLATGAVLGGGCPPSGEHCTEGEILAEGRCRRPCSVDLDCIEGEICVRAYCEAGNRIPGRSDAALDAGPADTLDPDAVPGDVLAAERIDAYQSDVPQPDASQPDASQPDVSQSDAAQPDTSPVDAARPDTLQPDAATCGPTGALCDDGDPWTANDLCVHGDCLGYQTGAQCATSTCPAWCQGDECCAGGCDGGDCACNAGCSCAFDLVNGDILFCNQGTRCHAEGTGTVFLGCLDRSSCDLVCRSNATCRVECFIGAMCMVRCEDTSTCTFNTCDSPAVCDGGVQVCNRACP